MTCDALCISNDILSFCPETLLLLLLLILAISCDDDVIHRAEPMHGWFQNSLNAMQLPVRCRQIA